MKLSILNHSAENRNKSRLVRKARLEIIETFRRWGSENAFYFYPAGNLLPSDDTSVLFTGSAISTLKPFLHKRNVPKPGIAMVQQCLRSQNTRLLFSKEQLKWASWFQTINLLSMEYSVKSFCEIVWSFFHRTLGIPTKEMRIRISSSDTDLMEFWKEANLQDILEVDKQHKEYYTHVFGIDGVYGRNLNLAIINHNTGELEDFGNIIVLEQDDNFLALELAVGVETLVSRLAGLSCPVQAGVIGDIVQPKTSEAIKLADALSCVVSILHSGIRPIATNRGRVLRRYLQSLYPLAKQTGTSILELKVMAEEFEKQQFYTVTQIPSLIVEYMELQRKIEGTMERGRANKLLSNIFKEL